MESQEIKNENIRTVTKLRAEVCKPETMYGTMIVNNKQCVILSKRILLFN